MAAAQAPNAFPFPLDHYGSVVLDAPFAAPIAADQSRLFVALRTGNVVAFDVTTNQALWSAELAAEGALVAADGRLFVPAADAIHALNAATGAVVWRAPAGPLSAPLAHRGGWLIVPLADGAIQAIRASDGVVLWAKTGGSPVAAPAAIDGDLLAVARADGRVAVMDILTGAVRWDVPLGAPATGLTLEGDRLFVGTRDAHLWALKIKDGKTDWRWLLQAPAVGAPAADADRVYVAALDNTVKGYSRDSGNQRWSHVLPNRPLAGPSLLHGVIVMTSAVSGRPGLVYVNAKSGTSAGQTPQLEKVDETMRAQFPATITAGSGNLPARAFIATAVAGGERWHVHAYRTTLIPSKSGVLVFGPRYEIIWRLDVRTGIPVFGQRLELFTRAPG